LYAISQDGDVFWSFQCIRDPGDMYGTSLTSPTIGPDGTIYITSANRLYAIAGTNALCDSAWPMYQQNYRHTGKSEKPVIRGRKQAGMFQIYVYGHSGICYDIQRSMDMVLWTTVTSLVCNAESCAFDIESSTNNSEFYRAVLH
jgi:hypothetical protein